MNVLAILVPMAIFIASMWLLVFFWALRSNQFDDPEGSARRILSDDDLPDDRQARRDAIDTTASDDHP